MNMYPAYILAGIICLTPIVVIVGAWVFYIGCWIISRWRFRPLQPDERGYLLGYKALRWNEYVGFWESPVFGGPDGYWINNHLKADREPAIDNTNGIYCCKYFSYWQMHRPGHKILIVRMVEPIIEHKLGYRANEAYIVREA